jgi:antitoxin component YwqK of YwqJK toxin-antitoxin module
MLMADFDEDAAYNNDLENLEAAAEDLYVNEIDTGKYHIKLTEHDLRKDGPRRVLYEDSLHVHYEGRVLDGAPDGLWRIYYKDGKIAAAVTYANGKADGVAMYYYDNDKQTNLAEVTFREDQIEGVYREFYENGQRKATIEYSGGLPDGSAEFFYDSGMIKIEGQYKKGLKAGKWKHYTETGETITREKWKKGQKKR